MGLFGDDQHRYITAQVCNFLEGLEKERETIDGVLSRFKFSILSHRPGAGGRQPASQTSAGGQFRKGLGMMPCVKRKRKKKRRRDREKWKMRMRSRKLQKNKRTEQEMRDSRSVKHAIKRDPTSTYKTNLQAKRPLPPLDTAPPPKTPRATPQHHLPSPPAPRRPSSRCP